MKPTKTMKFYLSSYKIGNSADELQKMTENGNKKVAYISNALDYSTDLERRTKSEQDDINNLKNLKFIVEKFDLRNYFDYKDALKKDISQYDVMWVRGGNTFVLRQAMKLSGFDNLLINLSKNDNDILYGGYSAGICVLAPNLKALQQVDDSTMTPYIQSQEVVWDGLGILDYIILPHYKSDHPESADIDKGVEFCEKHHIPFKTLRDGEVIIIE